MRILFYLPAFLVSCSCLCADETNRLFLTDDGFLPIHRSQLLLEAKNTKESLPVNQFPEGNWGLVQDGFQLSLRFDRPKYTNDEPVVAIILIRNVTSNVITYMFSSVAGKDGPVRFELFSDSKKPIPTNSSDVILVVSAFHSDVFPGTQIKYLERLDKEFNLTNGTYFVQAQLKVACPSCVDVESAMVPITITSNPNDAK
jgi:hypothetical protein